MMTLELAQKFFEEFTQESSTSFFALPQSGSARMNFVGETSQNTFVITYESPITTNQIKI